MSHHQWETAVGFGGYFRTCTGRLYPVLCTQAAATEAEAEAEVAQAGAAATMPATAPAATVDLPEWPKSWGQQTAVVDGKDACAQVRAYLQDEVGPWVKARTGAGGSSDAAVNRAVLAIVDRLQSRPRGECAAAGVELNCARAPTTCASCGKPTATRAFVGQSTCILCAARGGKHLSLLEANHILVTGRLSGKGAWLNAVCEKLSV